MRQLRFLFFGVLFAFFSCLWAGEAEDFLHKSAEQFHGAKFWSMDFRMIGVLPDGAIQSSYQGSLSLGNGDRFHLRLPGQEICSDGATLWQYSVTQHQVLIKNSADMEGGLHPSEMLFRYLRCKPMNIRQDKFQGVPVHILELDASQQIKSLTSMEVWLKDSDQTPVKLITVDKTGSSVIYSISNLRKNSTLNDQTFQFQAPAGVEEIDMR